MVAFGVCVCVVCFRGAEVDPKVGEVFNSHIHALHVTVMRTSDDGSVICESSDPEFMCDAL